MKYIFILLFALFLTMESQAQVLYTFTGTDTVVNAGTENLLLSVRGGYAVGAFQVQNTKVSGTVAGKTYFEASVNGTNYVTLDSLTNTNITTNTKIFIDAPCKYPYYRLRSVGSGTMSMITSAKAHFKPN